MRMKEIYENATIEPFAFDITSKGYSPIASKTKTACFFDDDFEDKIGSGIEQNFFYKKQLDFEGFAKQTSFSTSVSSEGSEEI